MQLEHSFTVPVGIEDAWSVLLDIERIAPCMPGAAITSVDGDDFTGTVKVKLGPIGLTYKGKASFIEKDPVAHRAVIDARGRDSRGSGTANAKVTATLTEAGDSTEVSVVTDLDITGKPAQFGRGVMVDVGNKLIGQFADCLAGQLTAGADDAVPAEPAAAAVPTDTAPADGAPADPAPADAAPAAGPEPAEAPEPDAPAARHAAASENGSAATSAATPDALPSAVPPARPAPSAVRRPVAADVEPINLIESAGPALVKRLAPVALAVIVLFVVLRRLRR